MTDRRPCPPTPPSNAGIFLRTWWMLFGNGALAVVAARMTLERDGFPSLLDAAFVAVVASLIAARLADIRRFGGRTADGARATMEHFRRYALKLLLGSSAVWGGANALAAL